MDRGVARLANIKQGDNQYTKSKAPSIDGTLSQTKAAKLLNVGVPTVERAVP